ncbi:MAG TPA: 5-deoxy-glucuronate isomerase [Candidatus Sulfopaludibacter sp.]|jgi:5-deoxy-glucuronate isomerase|nr:5-deoxy-glucuronate isomerase [Candidatus Sulfopaludibacter sp.]
MSTVAYPLSEAACVRRGTDRAKGRTTSLAPGTAAVRHLHYGRIILDATDAPLGFATGDRETGLICLRGSATVEAADRHFDATPYDAVYAPRDSRVVVTPGPQGCDLAEISAPVTGVYPVQFVNHAEVRKDPSMHFQAGGPTNSRDLNIIIGKNVDAGRILAGVTFTEPGNWASWPPHEHGATLEEAYVYVNMPAPAWGIQLVYTDPRNPELVVVVREGDCVVMPEGYHPNVAAPGNSIGFLWIMAAHREVVDRQFGVVNVQPEYATGGSGLEASRGGK